MRKLFLLTAAAMVAGFSGASVQAADYTPPPEMPLVYDWSGVYVGGHIGWAWLDPGANFPFAQAKSNGVIGGGYVGYNFEIAPSWILGIEGDFSGMDPSKTVACTNPAWRCNAVGEWTASLRGRVGFAIDRVLLYGTGGIAWLDYSGFTAIGGVKFRDREVLTGWTVGGGIEYAWTDNLISRVEYLYADFGKHTMQYDVAYPVDPSLHVLRVGLSYKF